MLGLPPAHSRCRCLRMRAGSPCLIGPASSAQASLGALPKARALRRSAGNGSQLQDYPSSSLSYQAAQRLLWEFQKGKHASVREKPQLGSPVFRKPGCHTPP